MFHANIEAGIEHVCNISNRNKFPLAFRAGQFVDDTFYCRQFDLYNVETIEIYYGRDWQSPKSKNWSNTRPQSYDCHCDQSYVYMYNVHPHHNATRKWRASVSNLRLMNTHY